MSLSLLPPNLNGIKHYLQMADDYDKLALPISYWCNFFTCLSFNSCLKRGINNNVHQFPFMLLVTGRLFALKQGVHLQRAKEDVIFLNGLMKCLQTFKKQKGLFRKVY